MYKSGNVTFLVNDNNVIAEKTIKKDGTNFGQNVAIRLADSEKYKYAPDNYKTIENFYRKNDDPETNPDLGGTGAITGDGNSAHTRGRALRFDLKLIVWTPIDAPKVLLISSSII